MIIEKTYVIRKQAPIRLKITRKDYDDFIKNDFDIDNVADIIVSIEEE